MRHFTVMGAGLWLAVLGSAALHAQTFPLPPPGDDMVGEVRSVEARHEDTLLDLARRNNLGYEAIELANPTVDPWMPGAGTVVVLPTGFILPPGPREGIVLNVPEMRLYYYPKPKKGERPVVITYPVSVGRMDWKTPVGLTRIVAKEANPVWNVPETIRAEHAANGDPLPKVVRPGPDNPLGKFALHLSHPGYLIHGTNNPNGLGMRVTHGCMRLYPEDIEALFKIVPVGTPVRILDLPYKVGWHNGKLYLQAHPPLEEDRARYQNNHTPLVQAVVAVTREGTAAAVDWDLAQHAAADPLGIPVVISANTPAAAVHSNTAAADAPQPVRAPSQHPH